MKNKYILIDINPDGNIEAETFNFEGIACVEELNRIMKGLAQKKSEDKKPDYYKKKVISTNKEKVLK